MCVFVTHHWLCLQKCLVCICICIFVWLMWVRVTDLATDWETSQLQLEAINICLSTTFPKVVFLYWLNFLFLYWLNFVFLYWLNLVFLYFIKPKGSHLNCISSNRPLPHITFPCMGGPKVGREGRGMPGKKLSRKKFGPQLHCQLHAAPLNPRKIRLTLDWHPANIHRSIAHLDHKYVEI